MSENIAISAIKERLRELNRENDQWLTTLAKDPRKGVQVAIKGYQARQKKQQLALAQHDKLLEMERHLQQQGYQAIAGIDEVGRGPLAGPVVTAAVILPTDFNVLGINDSKQVSHDRRLALFTAIQDQAIAIGIGVVDCTEIDEINIYQASKKAMVQAVEDLKTPPDYLLIDAMTLPLTIPQENLIKGDARSLSIAAASIVAKVTRDKMMADYDLLYPGYDFVNNAGYGTPKHLAGLEKFGITPIHRRTFGPVKNYLS